MSALLAVAMAIALALGVTGCASRSGTRGAEPGNRRLPRFETASIKLNKLRMQMAGRHLSPMPAVGRLLPGMPGMGVHLSGSDFIATTVAMAMIMDAYGQNYWPLNPTQVLGGPAWIWTDFYDINARVSDSIVNGQWKKLSSTQRWNQAMLMLRSLLINRFKLQVRHEKKVLPVYELVLARNGPKITEDKTDNGPCRITDRGPRKGLWMDVKSCTFRTFTGALSSAPELRSRALRRGPYQHGKPRDVQLSRVLVDKTGLQGRYSFKLHWSPHIYRPPGTPKPSGPSLFTVLQEQLGLRIEPGKAPVDVIVVEHIERPAPN